MPPSRRRRTSWTSAAAATSWALLAERGVRRAGVDVSPAMVALCRSRAGDEQGVPSVPGSAGGQQHRRARGDSASSISRRHTRQFLESAFHKMRPGAPLISKRSTRPAGRRSSGHLPPRSSHVSRRHVAHLVRRRVYQRGRAVPRPMSSRTTRSRRSRKCRRWCGFRRPAHHRAQRACRQAEPPALFLDGLRRDRAALTPAPGVTFRGRFGLRY